jgi:sortase A
LGRAIRLAGGFLVVAGVCTVLWALVVWQWQDPFTSVYTWYEQRQLASSYDKTLKTYRPLPPPRVVPKRSWIPAERKLIAREAKSYQRSLHSGQAAGRIKVPRLGLNDVLVAGTDESSLMKGPGWDSQTYLPGEGQLIYVAGHRTTYSAPFADIDALKPGDLVTIEVPYATFFYRVRTHVIVPADDLARLQSHGREVIALQACHPRFFATQRYIVYADPIRVEPRDGRAYAITAAHPTAAQA